MVQAIRKRRANKSMKTGLVSPDNPADSRRKRYVSRLFTRFRLRENRLLFPWLSRIPRRRCIMCLSRGRDFRSPVHPVMFPRAFSGCPNFRVPSFLSCASSPLLSATVAEIVFRSSLQVSTGGGFLLLHRLTCRHLMMVVFFHPDTLQKFVFSLRHKFYDACPTRTCLQEIAGFTGQ